MVSVKQHKTLSSFAVEFEREEDGRWIAEVPKLPGVMAYGSTRREAERRVRAIALRTLADTIEQGGRTPAAVSGLFGNHKVARR